MYSKNSTDLAYSDTVDGGFIYYNPETGEITDCDEYVTSVVIPSEIDGVKVTAIGENAFFGCSKLTNVTIPTSVTSIGGYAFENCTELKNIIIPDSVTSIGCYYCNPFTDCADLTIYCRSNSYAETYAKENNIAYVISGDADNDGILAASDAAAVLQKVLNNSFTMSIEAETTDYMFCVDVDGDGVLTASDAATILQKVLNNNFVMPCEKQ